MSLRFIAVDWGTTNRRVYLVDGGVVVDGSADGLGARAVGAEAYPAEVAAMRARFGDRPVLLAGMVGSTIGWREAPYRDLPADLATLAAGLLWIDPRTAIVPGLCQRDPPDVMRGEEVQLLGAHAAGLVPSAATLCQPGTHCKWATLRDGKVVAFSTAMTGELFALVRAHSILAMGMADPVADGEAFRAGVRRGAEAGAARALFQVRARALLTGAADGAAFASGALIGADVAHHRGEPVHLLADEPLATLYAAAVAELGGTSSAVDSRTAFIAGMARLSELIPWPNS